MVNSSEDNFRQTPLAGGAFLILTHVMKGRCTLIQKLLQSLQETVSYEKNYQ
jgi:hypothetical protein